METPQKNVKAIKDATSEAEHDKTSGTEKKKKVNVRFISMRTFLKNPVWNLEVIVKKHNSPLTFRIMILVKDTLLIL